ncbi:MAG TPA: DUF4445 domain-containing protein [Candidatus Pullichristensenella excrementipullorum]|nr:DUF4445 domain-containing protein [Candidatus Pullichristensenella excrementipullorum]
MPKLTVRRGDATWTIPFESGQRLDEVLIAHDLAVPRPCGGRGVCGKCAVELSGQVSAPNAAERRAGRRLSCQALLMGDALAVLPDDGGMEQIALFSDAAARAVKPTAGRLGAAVDIGTTTLACKLYDLRDGTCLSEAGRRNPQTAVAADVMGRVGHAMDGGLDTLRRQAGEAVEGMLRESCARAGVSFEALDALVVTGNTTMLYLLTGRDPRALSHAPFLADYLFDEETELFGRRTYLPPCMHAFVGADISCAVLAAGQCDGDGISLLTDIGTNGEIALWKDGVLRVASTAAGPAFEGAGISCGCGSVRGAIDRVWLEGKEVRAHTIGEASAVGVCGSGLIDAIAAFLRRGDIEETGATEEERLALRDGVALMPKDIRAVQLAKAAIAAGMETLMRSAQTAPEEIGTLYIAGGFGSHLNVDSAATIGLIPDALAGSVRILGNAALAGAARLLLDTDAIARIRAICARATFVNLGGDPLFNELYVDHMFF